MKCPNCGKEIANDSQFCESCGTKIKKNFDIWKVDVRWVLIALISLITLPIPLCMEDIFHAWFFHFLIGFTSLLIVCIGIVLLIKQKTTLVSCLVIGLIAISNIVTSILCWNIKENPEEIVSIHAIHYYENSRGESHYTFREFSDCAGQDMEQKDEIVQELNKMFQQTNKQNANKYYANIVYTFNTRRIGKVVDGIYPFELLIIILYLIYAIIAYKKSWMF